MKKILIIAYHFPPLWHIATIRITNFCKYLERYGWQPYVLTIKTEWGNARHVDIENDSLGVADRNIYRAYIFEPRKVFRKQILQKVDPESNQRSSYIQPSPQGLKKAGKLFREWVTIPDETILWFPNAVRLGQKIIRDNSIDVVLTSSGPYSLNLIGLWLKRRCQVPWLADFRDNWTQLGEDLPQPTPLHRWLNKWMENQVFIHADCITSVQPDLYIGENNSIHKKIKHLVNGFDPDDFRGISQNSDLDKFIITYAGSFYGNRQPDSFLKALSNLLKKYPEMNSSMEVRFLGRFSDVDIDRYYSHENLVKTLKMIGFIPYEDMLQELVNADVLLLIIPKYQKTVYSGKLFIYLGARRPILGLVPPDGLAAEVITQTNSGLIVQPDDIRAIEDSLEKIYRLWVNGGFDNQFQRDTAQYTYPKLVARLAAFLDQAYYGVCQ